MTFEQLFYLYYERHCKLRTRCPENAYYFFKAHGARWGATSLEGINRHEVQDWVDELGLASKSSATRAVNMLSAIINWGIKRGHHTGANPCIGVERFTIKARERFLMPNEMIRFKCSLESSTPLMKDFFWMCLLVGARRGNVIAMRWDELDTDLKIWQFTQKNGETQVTPLTDAALAILSRRKQSSVSPWVFPSPRRQGAHLVEPKRAWANVLKRAGLTNLRIHDLRRTVGSYLAINGFTDLIIGKTLGHKDRRSTAIYARLNLQPIRDALEATENIFIA